MAGAVDGRRKIWFVRVAFGLLVAGFLWFSGIGRAAPEIRWVKSYTQRVWTYAGGTRITAAYDFYKGGKVHVITDDNSKQSVAINKLSDEDQAWVIDELKKPRGLINNIVFGQWRDQSPLFWINVSFFTKGNLTESPVACVQYLLLDRRKRAIKRICDPVVLYPTVGKQNLEQISTVVMKQCVGPREQDVDGLKMLAYRGVLLLLNANEKEWLVLDTISKQNDRRLRELGFPSDWWDPRYPSGAWPSSSADGGEK